MVDYMFIVIFSPIISSKHRVVRTDDYEEGLLLIDFYISVISLSPIFFFENKRFQRNQKDYLMDHFNHLKVNIDLD